ncbi:MAG: lipopolysaccharide biosynthesis protein, partial [Candidatus Kapaibacterium sp.]
MRDKLRSLASDTAVYGASTIIQRFLTFLLTPLYTNYLSMSELGVVSNVYALIAFVNILYAFGFESAFMRFYRGSEEEKHAVFTQSLIPVVTIASLLSL